MASLCYNIDVMSGSTPWAEKLISWFEINKREFPFRKNPTPYDIWVSEIMLQQTRIQTVLPYYEAFKKAFPDMKALAKAKEDRLLKYWEGLGYYSRVRNMQKTARICMESYGGKLPDSYDELKALPGIGPYTASAILSLAYGKPYPVCDGNVLRIFARLTGDFTDVRDTKMHTKCTEFLTDVMRETSVSPGLFNEAMMELGETVCIPGASPLCKECVLRSFCIAKKKSIAALLPVRKKDGDRAVEKKKFILFLSHNRIGLIKRIDKTVLKGTYGFPETKLSKKALEELFGNVTVLPKKKHIFSHIEWDMTVYKVEGTEDAIRDLYPEIRFVTRKEWQQDVMIPSAFHKWSEEDLW